MLQIGILGAGAMGSFFGGLLAEAGEQVTLLDINAEHIQAVQNEGLRLQTDQGDRRIRSLAICQPAEVAHAFDLLLVFTKSLHTEAALRSTSKAIGPDTFVLTLQNGLGNVEKIAQTVALEKILVGMTTWPADVVGPGHVHSHGVGAIRLFTADGTPRAMLDTVAASLDRAGLHCQADKNVWTAIWEKVAFNSALNSLCAVARCTVDQIGLLPETKALALGIVDEVIAVALAKNIPANADKTKHSVEDAILNHKGHKPSMLQDVLAGRPTEIEFINGAVVALGQELDVPTLRTQTLLNLVRLIDAS